MSSEQPTPATMTFQWVFSYRNPGNIKYQLKFPLQVHTALFYRIVCPNSNPGQGDYRHQKRIRYIDCHKNSPQYDS